MRDLRAEEEITNSWKGDVTKPLVSISCVTYNHESFIRDAIEGFLMQRTTFSFKIFILDDASTDRNAEIIREYESKYPSLFHCVCLKENTWGKPNRRELVKPFLEARNEGKYIALCEGDDYWTDPYKLQKQVDFLEANPEYSFCTHHVHVVDEKNNYIKKISLEETRNYIYIQKDILQFNKNHTRTLSMVFKKECLPFPFHNEFTNLTAGDTYIKAILLNEHKAYVLRDIMGCYRIHPKSLWSSLQHVQLLKNYINDLKIYKNLFCNKYPDLKNFYNIKLMKYRIELFKIYITKIFYRINIRKLFLIKYKIKTKIKLLLYNLKLIDIYQFNIQDIFNNLNSGDISIDCGANVGKITEKIARNGVTVYAFEPNPYAFNKLKNRFKENENINSINKAVGDKADYLPLYFHEKSDEDEIKWSTGSSLLSFKTNINKDKSVLVKVIDIIQFINNLNKPVKVLKLDVEGVEFGIINKLIETGTVHKIKWILVETHEERIPELLSEKQALLEKIKKNKIRNIYLNWE